MELRRYLNDIATTYDRSLGFDSAAQLQLKAASDLLAAYPPRGITIRGSGGKGTPTFTPWIGFFDPDVTDSPQRGIYVVYLFSETLETVALSLNQGIEELRKSLGDRAARQRLARDAETIRNSMPAKHLGDVPKGLLLDSAGQRQRAYEAGSIAARTYRTRALPSDDTLAADLDRFLRKHEKLVRDFGLFAADRGFRASTIRFGVRIAGREVTASAYGVDGRYRPRSGDPGYDQTWRSRDEP